MEVTIVRPMQDEYVDQRRTDQILLRILEAARQEDCRVRIVTRTEDLAKLLQRPSLFRPGEDTSRRFFFLISLGASGINLEFYAMMKLIRERKDCMRNSFGALVVDGEAETATKACARILTGCANQAGCTFPGRPLVEGTGSLRNMRVTAGKLNCSLEEAYYFSAADLMHRLLRFRPGKKTKAKLLCLHACNPATSSTLTLWEMIEKHLSDSVEIRTISLRDGDVQDCAGCSFNTCMYYSGKSSCFYGGTITTQLYPALEACDGLILLVPNYNDAMGASLTAMVNRLTALYRRKPFWEKYIFAAIVTGYSGGDLIAQQIIDALNMNKAFILPDHFAIMETADCRKSLMENMGVEGRAEVFARHIKETMLLPGY